MLGWLVGWLNYLLPHWNPTGRLLEQTLRIQPRQMGISGIWKPKNVGFEGKKQRHVAALKSTRPSMIELRGAVGGVLIVWLSSPFNNPALALNVHAFLEHVPAIELCKEVLEELKAMPRNWPVPLHYLVLDMACANHYNVYQKPRPKITRFTVRNNASDEVVDVFLPMRVFEALREGAKKQNKDGRKVGLNKLFHIIIFTNSSSLF